MQKKGAIEPSNSEAGGKVEKIAKRVRENRSTKEESNDVEGNGRIFLCQLMIDIDLFDVQHLIPQISKKN